MRWLLSTDANGNGGVEDKKTGIQGEWRGPVLRACFGFPPSAVTVNPRVLGTDPMPDRTRRRLTKDRAFIVEVFKIIVHSW